LVVPKEPAKDGASAPGVSRRDFFAVCAPAEAVPSYKAIMDCCERVWDH